MRLKKCLLCGVRIGAVKGRSRGHRAHAEDVGLAGLPIELGPAFVPIHLRLYTELIRLRDEDLLLSKAHGLLAFSYILAHRGLCDVDLGISRRRRIQMRCAV